jgi:hypothetical protein
MGVAREEIWLALSQDINGGKRTVELDLTAGASAASRANVRSMSPCGSEFFF